MPGPVFCDGERITLRPIERDDAEFLQRAINDPDIRVPLGMSHPENLQQIEEGFEEWVESDESINLLVCLDDEPIGDVTVMHVEWTRSDIAYWLLPEYHGNGYASEAVSLLLDYLFENFEKRGVHARAFEFNDASRGLLESLGFTQEGCFRKNRFRRGEYVDEVVYGLLREEWVEDTGTENA